MDKQKILIIDDDQEACQTLYYILKEKGYSPSSVNNGKKAIEAATDKFFNLALIDLKLPDMQGTEVLSRIKEISSGTEAIIMTGYASLDTAVQAMQDAAFSYVTKPIEVSLINPGMEVLAVNSEIKKWFPDIDPSRKPFCYEMLVGAPRKDICHDCPVCKTFKDGRVHKSIMKKRVGDENRIYSVVSAPIKNKAGKITAAAELLEDITERRRAQQALQEHSVRLEEKVAERTKQLKDAQDALIRKEKLAVLGQLAGGVGHGTSQSPWGDKKRLLLSQYENRHHQG